MQEAGVKGYEAGSWFGLAAPKGVPAAVISQLSAEGLRLHPETAVAIAEAQAQRNRPLRTALWAGAAALLALMLLGG